jgi:hypothetical protein
VLVGIALAAWTFGGCAESFENEGGHGGPNAPRGWHTPDGFRGSATKSMDLGMRCSNSGPAVLRIDKAGSATLVATLIGDIKLPHGACAVTGTETVESVFRAKLEDGKPYSLSFTGCNRNLTAKGEAELGDGGKVTAHAVCYQADGTELFRLDAAFVQDASAQ